MASVDDRIVHATIALVSERGLADVTMVEIARTAGVARQTLYNHYSDVDEIITAGVRRHNAEAIARLHAAIEVVETPTDRIEQLVRLVVEIGSDPHHAPGSGSGASPESREAHAEFDRALDEVLLETLTRGIADGSFRHNLDVVIDTKLIRHLLGGIAAAAARSEHVGAVSSAGMRTVLAALRPRPDAA